MGEGQQVLRRKGFTGHLLELTEDLFGGRTDRRIPGGVQIQGETEAHHPFYVVLAVLLAHVCEGSTGVNHVSTVEQEFLHVMSGAHCLALLEPKASCV